MSTNNKITREVLESYLRCKTEAALKLKGEHGTHSEYEIWSMEQTTQQKFAAEANLLKRHDGQAVDKRTNLTASIMKTGPSVILEGCFEDQLLSISIDALVKDGEHSSKRSRSTYIPVLFYDGEVHAAQKALLELFAALVSELQENEPIVGLVFPSDGKPKVVRLEPGLKLARSALSDVKELHRGSLSPMLVLNSHCQVCEFQSRCHAEAVKDDNLSLLQGIKESQITRLNQKGIFTVNQLSYTFRMRRRPKRAKKVIYKHQFSLRALALREKKIFVHSSPTIAISGTRIYLDIEGTPRHGTYYLIGILTVSGERETYKAYWADTESESDQTNIFAKLLDHLSQFPDYRLLHFGSYEVVALRRMRARMTEPYQQQIEQVLKQAINILGIISPYVYFPTYSNSLKELGRFLGSQWSDPSSSGKQTLVWRARWLDSREPSLKEALIRYNNEDCAALRNVVEFLERALVCSSTLTTQGAEVVPTSTFSRQKGEWPHFGSTTFVLDDFRAINKLAYFDYQRDKVFTRTGQFRRKLAKEKNCKLFRPNKVVTHKAAKCPVCDNRKIEIVSQAVHEVTDLKFTHSGVKRWNIRYLAWRYCCTRCGHKFVPAAFQKCRTLPKYGRGLISWCIYQMMIGGQNINRVHRSLLELFNISVPNGSVYKFKKTVSAYFRRGYEKIQKDVLSGGLICVDETSVNLRQEKGYVWVFASSNSVFFIYRNSREGSFLSDLLRQFKGVLVSDFYTAYDSLNVRQQRCLLHLIRDMNEDVLINPFDDELKSIATRFSALLRTTVETIDRYGLKARHLNKHRRHAERFCDWVTGSKFDSEVAKGYARRISKYREYLFAFLSYDGVPWNNNNAEHAIKSFAKFRRTSNGIVTEGTVSDYLVILSVCLTCEYRGINFLKVLLGDEKRHFGFGPKHFPPLRLRVPHVLRPPRYTKTAVAEPDIIIDQAGEEVLDHIHKNARGVSLSTFLPKTFDGLSRFFKYFRYRAAPMRSLAVVDVDPKKLQRLIIAIVYVLRKGARHRTMILSAQNVRFNKPHVVTGLTGGFVAVSVSDGGRIEQLQSRAREDQTPPGLEAGFSLEGVPALAKEFGGAAVVRSFRTARKVVTTLVTIYIPRYSRREECRSA